MNNATISILFQLKDFSRFVLRIAAWIYCTLAVILCIMISFSTLSYFEASSAIAKAVIAIAAYHLVPFLIDRIIRRVASNRVKKVS